MYFIHASMCMYIFMYHMVPKFQGAQFSLIGLLQIFSEMIFVDGEPCDLLKCLLITVIVLLGEIMRCHSNAERFRRNE